jgi:4-hydroxy-tetrahydrodipicolinate synthase
MRRLQPLMQALFVESNPIPLKAALDLLGLAPPHLRLPLTTAAGTTVAALRRALAHLREPAESKP